MKKPLIAIFLISSIFSCSKNPEAKINEIQGFETVDSVWCNPPGTPHSLQTDYLWHGKTHSGFTISRRNSEIRIGDTVWIVNRSNAASNNRL
jgi:hypothetical protein